MWKTVCKAAICLILLGYVSVAFALARMDNANRTCTGIDLRIEGSTIPKEVLEQGVNTRLGKYGHKLKGEKLKNIDLQDLENYLSEFSNFEWVECSFDPDSRLRITVAPIKAEVRVFESGAGSFYINRAGKRIAADADFFIDVPVLIATRETDRYIQHALPVIRYVSEDPELSPLIAAYKIDSPTDVLLIPRLHGHVINFGDSTRASEKRAAILTAYREVLPSKGWNTYDTISVKFKRQIVASRSDKSRDTHGADNLGDEDLEEAPLQELIAPQLANNTEDKQQQNNE